MKFQIERAYRYKVSGKSIKAMGSGTNRNVKENVKGVGCCSGMVTGQIKIITPETIKDPVVPGSILVGNYFEPGWIGLFSRAAGIISEKGNLLSHTAILCREMGIPSVVGARRITTMLQDGDIVQMDGATGEIKIIHGK